MQAARTFTLRQTERFVQRLSVLVPADRGAHAESNNDTQAEYEELASLINETSQLLATWKRKRGDTCALSLCAPLVYIVLMRT